MILLKFKANVHPYNKFLFKEKFKLLLLYTSLINKMFTSSSVKITKLLISAWLYGSVREGVSRGHAVLR